jgi:glutamine amidotransferase
MKVGLIDYGVGNLGSVLRALEDLQVKPLLIDRPKDLHSVDCVILPGVGNFSDCAHLLRASGWDQALHDEVIAGQKPLLGVCVGMQLLADMSVEGADTSNATPGLGFIPGDIVHLSTLGCQDRIPHVGWNSIIRKDNKADPLLSSIPDGTDFYFVHSYAFVAKDENDVLATTDYGVPITAAVRRGHIWGTQFHPEKSSRAGFQLLRNFLAGPIC